MANIHADFDKLMAEQTAFMDSIIAKFPSYKNKGYMGSNIVMMDFSKENFTAALAVAESLDSTQMRVNNYPAKNRIAIIF